MCHARLNGCRRPTALRRTELRGKFQ
jgi:hypothetical protein